MKRVLFLILLVPFLTANRSSKPDEVLPQKWVWVGTSIPAMYGIYSYPAQVGRMLIENGFNVNLVNESLASSLVPWDKTNRLSLSATMSDEALYFAGTGSESNSFEKKILDNHPDVLIIDHGYNCRSYADTRLGDINSTDRSTFYGAYNYVIRAAYTQNPKLRIAIIIPPNNVRWSTNWATEARKLTAMRNALLTLASRYGCICVDLMKCMGYNDYSWTSMLIDQTHMTQETANYAAAILYERLRLLAYDHKLGTSFMFSRYTILWAA